MEGSSSSREAEANGNIIVCADIDRDVGFSCNS